MTDAEKVSTLRSAIERADKALDWILAEPLHHPEGTLTTASRVRRILRAAMRKTTPEETGTKTVFKLPDVRIDIQAMKANGTLKEMPHVDKRKTS